MESNRTLQGIIQRAAELVISHLPCCSFVVVTVFILKNPSLKLYRKKKKIQCLRQRPATEFYKALG